MSQIIFYLSLTSILIIYLLFVGSYVTGRYQFFPPPRKESWQYRVFWSLFRVFVLSLLLVSCYFYEQQSSLAILMAASVMLIGGFGVAAYLSYSTLGSQNSHGLKSGFVMEGFFRYSRNPIYVASIIGMFGFGIFVNSGHVWILLLLWGAMYLLAPIVEEPWLEEQYGIDYVNYKNKVPRFVGIVKKNET